MMKAFKIQNKDFILTTGRTETVEDRECLCQRLEHRLKLDNKSWYLGPEEGMPWFEIYNAKEISDRMVRANVEKILKADSEVIEIQSIEIEFSRPERHISLSFMVESIYGIVEGEV